jgi:Fe-S cluster biogenesis protein NfuA
MVHKLLLDNHLIEVPKAPLLQRLQQVIDKIRPRLQKYHGNIELVSFKPPNTLEICLVNHLDAKSPVELNLLPKIEQSIKYYCPEITQIITID